MLSFPIAAQPGIDWNLFSDNCERFPLDDCPQIATVLGLVRALFIGIFEEEVVNSHPKLAVLPCSDDPETFRKNCLIFLSSTERYYLQHIYQFSHELCHFMVPSEVCKSFRWLEETLCETMSWCVLQWVNSLKDQNPWPWLAELCERDPGYMERSMAKRQPMSPAPLSLFIQEHLDYLKEECYDRGMNATIAYDIFPMLSERPVLWRIVPWLDKLRDGQSVADALSFLLSSAKIERSVADPLYERFIH